MLTNRRNDGDGVIITDLINKNSENIIIDNCNIKGCRRQGISIISGENIEINNCEIFNIEGTAPQAAIDLESWNVRQNIDNIKIHNNKIYDLGSKQAIFVLEKAKTVDISNNELYGGIYSNNIREILNIEKNEVYDCKICIELPEDFKAGGEFIKRSVIKNNKLNNTSICLKNVNDAVIRNNILKNKGSIIYNTNIAIYRKIFYDNAIKQFHIGVENTDMNYKVFVGQNEYYNIDENIEWISNKQIEISNDENKIEKYIDRVEKGD